MENKINLWKIATITLLLILIGYLFFNQPEPTYEFGPIKIKQQDLKNLAEQYNGNAFLLCSMEKDICLPVQQVKNE